MFNKKDFSAEIASSMESNLVTHAIEKKDAAINKFAKALDYLNSVAEIFDELGLEKEAEATTTLLEVVAKKKSSKKSKPKKGKKKPVSKSRKSKKDEATEGLTSEKMESNLKEKGWVFNADDGEHLHDVFRHPGHRDHSEEYEEEERNRKPRKLRLDLLSKNVKDDKDNDHHDSCMCSMCMDADDIVYAIDSDFPTVPETPAARRHMEEEFFPYEKDEQEQDLARMFHDIEEDDGDDDFSWDF